MIGTRLSLACTGHGRPVLYSDRGQGGTKGNSRPLSHKVSAHSLNIEVFLLSTVRDPKARRVSGKQHYEKQHDSLLMLAPKKVASRQARGLRRINVILHCQKLRAHYTC